MKEIVKTIRVAKLWKSRKYNQIYEVWSGLNLIKIYRRRKHARKFAKR